MSNQLIEVRIDPPVDLHAHLRNNRADGDGRMELNMRHAVNQTAILFHIGNGSPAILDQESANRELAKARACLKQDEEIELFATPLLRDDTRPETIIETRVQRPRTVYNWKAFLSGVSNDGGNSVTDFKKIDQTIAAFYDPAIEAPPVVLDVHAERKFKRSGKRIQMRDREWYAIRTDVQELLERHPLLTIRIKHVSDRRTLKRIRVWRKAGLNVYAEICPHYLFRSHEDLYEGPGGGTAFNLHDLCWPLYKDEKSMQALREAVLSGEDWIMMGLDWACHNNDPSLEKGVKVNNDGIVVGGVTILPAVAISMLIDLFLDAGCLVHLNGYISGNARRLHNLAPATTKWLYLREPWRVPTTIQYEFEGGEKVQARPFMRGNLMNWAKSQV